jgi:spermidine/putrescine transport system substrate-binding protein
MTTTPNFNRRSFLLGAGAAALGGPAFLAACGSGSGGKAGASGSTVSWANWQLYIEGDDPKTSPTLKGFTAATGIKVDYQAVIEDNDTFTSKYEGKLAKKQGIGFDLAVVTSWMASRWIKNGWALPLDAANIPNKANALQRHLDAAFDPGRKFSLPYAEGQTGIAYFPDKAGIKIESMADFLKPELKGKVSILSELRDCGGLFLLMMGVDPETATKDQMLKAIAEVQKYKEAGQFYKITGNEYTDLLDREEVVAAVAWSGDVEGLKKTKPNLEWVVPKEGGMSFIDTFVVPVGAKNQAGGEKLINYLYDPKVSGPLFEAISYVSPVKDAGTYMSPEAAKNPLINPPADAKIHAFRDLDDAESTELDDAWAKAIQ